VFRATAPAFGCPGADYRRASICSVVVLPSITCPRAYYRSVEIFRASGLRLWKVGKMSVFVIALPIENEAVGPVPVGHHVV
jgi:hypothetical protein